MTKISPRVIAEALVAGIGLLLLVSALAANQAWFDRHFLPVFFLTREEYVLGETLARLFVAATGIAMVLLLRPLVGRLVSRVPAQRLAAGAARLALAIGLALAASELILRHTFALAVAQGDADEEPLRRPDARLGWAFVPSRSGHAVVADRDVFYTIDAHGYRVAGEDAPVDFNRPAILFTGESIMAGFGLNWHETIPARTGALLKTQSVDIAVFGYANDQAYLRLAAELPRFKKPVAVVSLFSPSLFVRNLDDDRPRLAPGLVWQPGIGRSRLATLLRFLVPYHSETEIRRGMDATRQVLLATMRLARAHHAVPLVVVPQFAPETPVETNLRHYILDDAGIDYIQVRLDPAWRIAGDLHPDARADRAIAEAVAARLRWRGIGGPPLAARTALQPKYR